jgi:hypothetical protein
MVSFTTLIPGSFRLQTIPLCDNTVRVGQSPLQRARESTASRTPIVTSRRTKSRTGTGPHSHPLINCVNQYANCALLRNEHHYAPRWPIQQYKLVKDRSNREGALTALAKSNCPVLKFGIDDKPLKILFQYFGKDLFAILRFKPQHIVMAA